MSYIHLMCTRIDFLPLICTSNCSIEIAMKLLLLGVLFGLAAMPSLAYYPMVFEKQAGGGCTNKVQEVPMVVQRPSGGSFSDWNLCVVPRQGQTSGIDNVWGIATYEAAQKVDRNNAVIITPLPSLSYSPI